MAIFIRGSNYHPRYNYNPFDEWIQPQLFDQHFGRGLLNDELFSLAPSLLLASRPRHFTSREQSGLSEVKMDKDTFQVMLDVQQFAPEELSVKTVDNTIVIEGKHEEKQDEHGFISRHFTRRYVIPKNVKAEEFKCDLSSDGVLTLTAPRQTQNALANERPLPINSTGEPAIKKTGAIEESNKTKTTTTPENEAK